MLFKDKLRIPVVGEKVYLLTDEEKEAIFSDRSSTDKELEPGMGGVSPQHLDGLLESSSELVSVDFALTSACNFKCVWCYRPGEEWGKLLLDFELVEKVVKEAMDLGVKFFVLTGGEPLLYKSGDKNYFDVVDYIKNIYSEADKKVTVLTFSDVAMINKEKAKMLAKRGVGLCLKKDSMNSSCQDAILGKDGGCLEMEEGYQHLFDAGYGTNKKLSVSVNSVVAKGIQCGGGKKVDTLYDMIDLHMWVMSHNMEHSMVPIHYCGEVEDEGQEEGINVLEIKALYDIIAAIDGIEFNDPWFPYSSFPKNKTCVRPGRVDHIRATGKVTSCSECPLIDDYVFGDIREDNIKDMIRSDKFAKIKQEFKNREGSYICNVDVCDLRKLELCRGGCATRSAFSKIDPESGLLIKNNDPKTYSSGGEDPLCPAWVVLAQKQGVLKDGYYEKIVDELLSRSNIDKALSDKVREKVVSEFESIKGEHCGNKK